jgi:hypothetical protein
VAHGEVVVVGMKASANTDLVGSLRWASSRPLLWVGGLVVASIGSVASRGPLIVVVVVVVAEEAVGIGLALTVAVVVGAVVTNGIPVESTGQVSAGPDPEVTLAESIDLGWAGTRSAGNNQMKLADSPLGPESPVGGLHNTRQILPDLDRQGADCRTPQAADMAGRVDDTGRHTIRAEYPSAAVGRSDTHCRQDRCLPPTSAAVASASPCLWVTGLWVCLGRRRSSVGDPDQLIRTLSLR